VRVSFHKHFRGIASFKRSRKMKNFLTTGLIAVAIVFGAVGVSSAAESSYKVLESHIRHTAPVNISVRAPCQMPCADRMYYCSPAEIAIMIKTGKCPSSS
jgi:hypothetical protein